MNPPVPASTVSFGPPAVSGLKHSQITNNVIFDAGARDNGAQGFENLTGKVKPEPGQHADLVVSSPKGVTSTVICRDNRHPDGTRLSPRDNTLQIIEGGLMDLPLEAGRNVTLTPDGGKIRIDVAAGAKTEGMGLTHCVDPADPAKDSRFAGRPGDYAVGSGYMYVYTGDGKAHRWRRMSLDDY